jgi:hypothetical protein
MRFYMNLLIVAIISNIPPGKLWVLMKKVLGQPLFIPFSDPYIAWSFWVSFAP